MPRILPNTAVVSPLLSSEIRPDAAEADVRNPDAGALTPARMRAFLAAIQKPSGIDGCWLWCGSVNADGYPSGRPGGQPHRLAYEWMVGPIPEGLELDHLCRNAACVNPHHLEPVTPHENKQRARQERPWQPRRYCRRGHVLDALNGRVWSNGHGKYETRCYTCHDGVRRGNAGCV